MTRNTLYKLQKRALEKLIGIYNGDTFGMRDQVF